jgi:hypothetical protein
MRPVAMTTNNPAGGSDAHLPKFDQNKSSNDENLEPQAQFKL